MIDLTASGTQAAMAEIVGVSQPAISGMLSRGILTQDASLGQWLIEYCSHLREMAAGRSTDGSLDLATERALLARSQREGQDIKNEVARGTYAPIDALTDVLANASQAVVDHLDQIPAGINRVCPSLPQSVRDLLMTEIARSRNEMVRKTASLMSDVLEAQDIPEDDTDSPAFGEEVGQ